MAHKYYIFIVLLCTLLAPVHGFSWGENGHRIVATIAENRLSPVAKKAIKDILGQESMVQASTWMDFIKSDHEWNFSKPYHHVNIPDGQDYWTSKKNPQGDIVRAIIYYEDVLRDKKSSKQDKNTALKFLIHLIGDIHQPLHVGRQDDVGGNKVFIKWFSEETNLHRVWDESLIAFQKLSYTEYTNFIDHINSKDARVWEKASVINWVNESMEKRKKIYSGLVDENGKTVHRLSYEYNFDNIEMLNDCLRRAGVRLAKFLNNIFEGKKNVDADIIREKLGNGPRYDLP